MGTEQAGAASDYDGAVRLVVGAISGMRRMAQTGAASAMGSAVSCRELEAVLSRLDQAAADGVPADLMDLVGAISGMRSMAQAGASSAMSSAESCQELDGMLSLLEGKARAALDDFGMGAQG